MRATPGHAVAAPPPPAGTLRPTKEGLLWLGTAVLLGVLAWAKSLNLLLILSYAMAALFVLNGLLARSHARRVVAVRPPVRPPYAGEESQLRVKVRNTGTRPATVEVAAAGRHWHLERLPAGAEVVCDARHIFPRRGRGQTARPAIRSGFPFGFVRCEYPGEAADDVVVLPAVGRADADGLRRWVMRQAGGDGRSRKVLRRVTTDHADVRGVRPYRPGDSIRSIHWRSSARQGEPMVREYDAAPSPDLVVVVEPWLPANPSAADRAKLEAALSLAATVVRTWCAAVEMPATVIVAGKELAVAPAAPNEPAARTATVLLADAAGVSEPISIDGAGFGRSLSRAARVVVSSRPDSPLAAALTRSTGKPFVALDPSARLPWYQPPPAE